MKQSHRRHPNKWFNRSETGQCIICNKVTDNMIPYGLLGSLIADLSWEKRRELNAGNRLETIKGSVTHSWPLITFAASLKSGTAYVCTGKRSLLSSYPTCEYLPSSTSVNILVMLFPYIF